jgi:hypothetical protein
LPHLRLDKSIAGLKAILAYYQDVGICVLSLAVYSYTMYKVIFKMRTTTTFLLAILLSVTTSYPQFASNQNKVWAFGYKAGVDFKSGMQLTFLASDENTASHFSSRDVCGSPAEKAGRTAEDGKNHVAPALWSVGIPTLPINFHPIILWGQLAARRVGIYASPILINH